MRLAVEDSRRYPNDQSWALGIWYHHFEDHALNFIVGYRSLDLSWGRRRRPKLFQGTSWGLGVFRDPDGWSVWFGPWLWEVA